MRITWTTSSSFLKEFEKDHFRKSEQPERAEHLPCLVMALVAHSARKHVWVHCGTIPRERKQWIRKECVRILHPIGKNGKHRHTFVNSALPCATCALQKRNGDNVQPNTRLIIPGSKDCNVQDRCSDNLLSCQADCGE